MLLEVSHFMSQIVMNSDKRIGKVIFIVEGEKTEPTLISHIFGTLFNFNVVISNKKGCHELKKEEDKYSVVYIIQAEYPQINKLENSKDYFDKIYRRLTSEYHLDVENSAIFYIFDRDRNCNRPAVIRHYLNQFSNSRESKEFDMHGLFLLSYPCVEAFLLHANFKEEELSCGAMAKEKTKDFLITKIQEENLKNVLNLFLKFCENMDHSPFSLKELDDFTKRNHSIFNLEEQQFQNKSTYHTLSLLIVALLDLDLLSIQNEEYELKM